MTAMRCPVLRFPAIRSAKALLCLTLCLLTACGPADKLPEDGVPEGTASGEADSQEKIQAQPARAGVGKKGQSLQDDTGVAKIISGPAAALFNIEQKMVLEVQIPQALQLFKATEGRFPKSHEEFMERIVKANRLQLPELPERGVYRFDPDKGELWVYDQDDVPQ